MNESNRWQILGIERANWTSNIICISIGFYIYNMNVMWRTFFLLINPCHVQAHQYQNILTIQWLLNAWVMNRGTWSTLFMVHYTLLCYSWLNNYKNGFVSFSYQLTQLDLTSILVGHTFLFLFLFLLCKLKKKIINTKQNKTKQKQRHQQILMGYCCKFW